MALMRLETCPPFAEIILNRPEKRNALSIQMWAQIPALVAKAESDPDIKILLIHGGDSGSFAAGADISEFETIYGTRDSAERSGSTIGAALRAVETCKKPVIAVIEGACVGGGVSLAMACDLRIASPSAKLGITPAKLGLVYPPTDTRLLLRHVTLSHAKDLLFTGRIISADEALMMNVVDKLADCEDTLSFAKAYAQTIATNSQWSVRAIKQMISGLTQGWSDDSPQAKAMFLDGFENADFQEGYRAFLEKRKPDFKL